mgnify:CR=1 FL=1
MACFLAHLFNDPRLRRVVIIPSVAQDQHGGFGTDFTPVLFPEDLKGMAKTLKQVISKALKELDKIEAEQRISKRIDKFCAMGVVVE